MQYHVNIMYHNLLQFLLLAQFSNQHLLRWVLHQRNNLTLSLDHHSRRSIQQARFYSRFILHRVLQCYLNIFKHHSLQLLQQTQFTNQHLLHWALNLQNFNITINFIKDSNNVVADELSRVHGVDSSIPTILHSTAVKQNPNDEVSTLVRATKAEMLTLVNEYNLTAPHGATKTDLHNLILHHLLDNDAVTPESHEHSLIADKNALAAMKMKLELANAERERLKEQVALEKETLQRKEREATLQRKALQLHKEQAALQREQVEFQREREREQLELKERHLEIQREHNKKQVDSALDHRRKELELETLTCN
ncbi:putative uncharacterized protein DDB_G0271982 [Procambarus clarkii]|uniref:putative uncharacterized protein DDB_G0271982 n=1 Tax=Procambarus clarkii TaxID=6728 RepID=UPI003743828A